MDPDSNIDEQLRLAEKLREALSEEEPLDEDDVSRLCDLIEALDDWIVSGGFIPSRWATGE